MTENESHMKINLNDVIPIISRLSFMFELNNVLNILDFNLKYNTDYQLYKKRKKDNTYIEKVYLSEKYNWYENYNVDVKDLKLCFELRELNEDEKILSEPLFLKTLKYYRELFDDLKKNKELYDKINNNKSKYLRLDPHGEGHKNIKSAFNPNNNNTFYISDNDERHINEILFDQFYKNYNIIYNFVYATMNYLTIQKLYNTIPPIFLQILYNKYNFDTKIIYDTTNIYKTTLHLVHFNNKCCFFDENNIPCHPYRIQLIYSTKYKKYRLLYENNDKYLNKSEDVVESKITQMHKIKIDKMIKKQDDT
jgi:hypothetical protein